MNDAAQRLIEMRGIVRHFGSAVALRGADFACDAGEIHALLGENGAGKTTLMHVLFGMLAPDAGSIAIGGREVRLHSARDAMALGLGMVHQHFTQVPDLTVAENVWLGRPGWRFDRAAARALVRKVGEATGLALDPDARAEDLSVGLRQRLEIVKALSRDARVLILDEPTATLAPAEVADLFAALRRLKASGVAVVLITHKLSEVLAIADRVSVLRAGERVFTAPAAGLDAATLARAMIGEAAPDDELAVAQERSRRAAAGRGPIALEVEALRVVERGRERVRGASFAVHGGEIVGIAAVEGNGQRELLRSLAGLIPHGGRVRTEAGPPAFVPEDRQLEGLVLDFTVAENLALGSGGLGWVSARDDAARRLIERFDIRPADPAAHVRELSGGNQQKIVLARELSRRPAVLIAENPTRGLDIHAAAQVHAELRRAASDGMAVLLYSSDLDEVLALGDRVAVVVGGEWRWVDEAARTREQVGAMMLGAA